MYSKSTKRKFWPKVLFISVIVFVIALLGSVYVIRRAYEQNLRPVSSSQRDQEITIPTGATAKEIAEILKDAGLIRATWAFEWYVRNEGLRQYLKAGTYELRPSMSVQEISNVLTEGRVATNLVTILPGVRLDQIRHSLINTYGFDEEAVDQALRPENYAGHPALVDKPRSASLEGYIYPESFSKTADTDPKSIIRASLDQMQDHLTPEIRDGIVRQGLTVYQGITLASIVEREVPTPEDRKVVAQVFLRRIREGIKLQSDATASYGAVLDGEEPSRTYVSAYNTYVHEGLTPTPISNVSESSLEAVANPASTDYLYFVSGDDGTTHFSHTLEQHEANVRRYCTILCQ